MPSKRSLETFYEPNLRLTQAHGLLGYNAGYAEVRGRDSFDQHQKNLVWRLLGDVHIGPESTVLDVGCGVGGPSGWIFDRYRPGRLIGIEYCSTSVRAAEQRWSGTPERPIFLQGDAQHLPLPDESVDVIFNLESALHYADKRRFISECMRILKPGGTLCLGDITTQYKRLFVALGILNIVSSQFSTHARLWSFEDYMSAFKALGLRVLRHEEVARQAADSLFEGLTEVSRVGWNNARGYRGRYFYLRFMEKLLRHEWLAYDLFAVSKR
ncbi:MAG: methyltransferase domain-containing protein [Phycisphaerales bacterium]|nr:methyltransferase domain-containing protein [Phycisphaerales bacterium]